MKVVYIAGPFRGANAWEVEQNIRRAEEYAFKVWGMGMAALCPHTNTRFFDGTLTDDIWLEGTKELLRRCDAMYVLPGWTESAGTKGEMVVAEEMGIPQFYIFATLCRWNAGATA